MTDYIYQRFPQHIESIRLLLKKNPTFGEVCDDYEEICTWVHNNSHLAGQSSAAYDQARDLMQDLEDEIKKMVKESS